MATNAQPAAADSSAGVAPAPNPNGATVPWLDPEEMRAWRGLIEMTGDVRAALDAELLGEFGLSEGDYGVLVNLSEAPDRRMRMCDLAVRMHLSPSGLTRRLDGLVRDGLVVREPSQDDRRVSLAVLTDDGFARLEQAAPVHVAGVRRQLFDHMTRTQIRQLGAAFDHLRERRAGIDSSSPGTTR
jgi:DNA-binding MarR family transcriptional regulator